MALSKSAARKGVRVQIPLPAHVPSSKWVSFPTAVREALRICQWSAGALSMRTGHFLPNSTVELALKLSDAGLADRDNAEISALPLRPSGAGGTCIRDSDYHGL